MGGLLAAYHLSQDSIFLEKAQDLGNRILPVFDTPSGLPLSSINLHRQEGVPDRDNNGFVSTAEAATLQLEFRYLSYLTGEDIYWEKAEAVRLWLFAMGSTILIMTGYGRSQSSETSTWSCTHLYRVCVIHALGKTILIPLSIVSPKGGRYRTATIRLGSRGDSYYEYLLLVQSYIQVELLIFCLQKTVSSDCEFRKSIFTDFCEQTVYRVELKKCSAK